MGNPLAPNYKGLADSICDMIRQEREAVDAVLRDTRLFLAELPQDLGRGSLNGWRVQLQHKVEQLLPPNEKVSGAGTASAGLPGYAGDYKGE